MKNQSQIKLEAYLNTIEGKPLLSASQEKKLLKQASLGDGFARQKVVEANLKLVVKVAKRYLGRQPDLMELIEVGNIGLIRAAEVYDWRKSYKFSTYATWWIRAAIEKHLDPNWQPEENE